jgi:hypothetical protein
MSKGISSRSFSPNCIELLDAYLAAARHRHCCRSTQSAVCVVRVSCRFYMTRTASQSSMCGNDDAAERGARRAARIFA